MRSEMPGREQNTFSVLSLTPHIAAIAVFVMPCSSSAGIRAYISSVICDGFMLKQFPAPFAIGFAAHVARGVRSNL